VRLDENIRADPPIEVVDFSGSTAHFFVQLEKLFRKKTRYQAHPNSISSQILVAGKWQANSSGRQMAGNF
jgi:hypothetical protein